VPVCAAANGNKYFIPLNLMFKPDILEFGTSIGKPKHAFIQKCINQTQSIRSFFVGEVDFEVKKITEEQFNSQFAAYYNCKNDDIILF
jgi:D-alanine-D-alanine ligase